MRASLFLFASFYIASTHGVFRISAVEHRPAFLNGNARANKPSFRELQKFDVAKLMRRQSGARSSSIKMWLYNDVMFVGNITIGTPPQPFQVGFQLFTNDFYVMNASLSFWNSDGRSAKQKYNSSQSSTSNITSDQAYTFYIGSANGKRVSDVVNLGINATLTFGVADGVSSWISYYPVDGVFGLYSLRNKDHPPLDSPVKQLADQLPVDAPTFTWAQSKSLNHSYNGTANVTFGDYDTANCLSDWVFTPSRIDSGYSFHVQSVTVGEKTVELDLNASTTNVYTMFASKTLGETIVNATGAVLNNATQRYELACGATVPNVVLKVNGTGSSMITLVPADFIGKTNRAGVCFVDIYVGSSDDYKYFYLNERFWNNHCFGYDSKNRVGFALRKGARAIE